MHWQLGALPAAFFRGRSPFAHAFQNTSHAFTHGVIPPCLFHVGASMLAKSTGPSFTNNRVRDAGIGARRLSWFGNITYTIGGLDYSTNDVEHGMLRANAPSPASIPVLLGQPQWAAGSLSNDDPRLAFVSFCIFSLQDCWACCWYSWLVEPCTCNS